MISLTKFWAIRILYLSDTKIIWKAVKLNYLMIYVLDGAVLSTRAADGSNAPAVRVWWVGCLDKVKVDIKSFNSEGEASKSVKRFQIDTAILKSQFLPQISNFVLPQSLWGLGA